MKALMTASEIHNAIFVPSTEPVSAALAAIT